jgi:hypothetical protein
VLITSKQQRALFEFVAKEDPKIRAMVEMKIRTIAPIVIRTKGPRPRMLINGKLAELHEGVFVEVRSHRSEAAKIEAARRKYDEVHVPLSKRGWFRGYETVVV